MEITKTWIEESKAIEETLKRLQKQLKISKHELFRIEPEDRLKYGHEHALDIVMYDMAIKAIRFQQNVVRCGDCKHKVDREFNRVVCMRHTIETHKDGYCHEGKRRDEE